MSYQLRYEGDWKASSLWSHTWEVNKLPLVKWPLVTQPRDSGDLGIISLDTMNKALPGKWIWRYGKKDEGIFEGNFKVEVW